MKKFIIEESEIKRILSMHRTIKEQTAPAAPAVDPSLQKLRDAVKSGCFSNGKLFLNKTKNTYFFRGIKKSTKQEIDFFPDMTYSFVDGSKKGKWTCPALTKPVEDQITTNLERLKTEANWLTKEDLINSGQTIENIENPLMYTKKDFGGNPRYQAVTTAGIFGGLDQRQKDKINNFKVMGYKLIGELTPKELSFFKPMVVSPVKDGLFSTDLIMYADPSQITQGVGTGETKTNITQTIKNAVQNRIPKDKKDCKDTIKTYYYAFKKKRPLSQDEFSALKEKTQACKNEFYGDWDVLSGGRKMDNYLDIMSGGIGGPSRAGDDAKWRLN
jgi:hypothetical protein